MPPDQINPQPNALRAAQYVRMSTEHQQYSTNNQADKILEYAQRRNIEIVRTYADEGKSGLSLGERASLQKLGAMSCQGAGLVFAGGAIRLPCGPSTRLRIKSAMTSNGLT